MHVFLQVALAELRAANQRLQTVVVSVMHISVLSLLLQTLDDDMQVCIAGST